MKIPLNKIRIAHRGLHGEDVLENTIPAFLKCIKEEVPIELDVHILKDNKLVVFHDDDLYRLCGKNLKIKDLTWDDLSKIKLKNGEHIPSLEEVLDLVKGRVLLDIEIKTDVRGFSFLKELSRMLDVYKGDFLVKSFNPLYILWFRIKKPEYTRGILVSSLKNAKMPKFLKYMLFHMWFNFLINPDFIAFNKKDLPSKSLLREQKKGIPILIWTTKENDTIEFDGIIFEQNI